MNYSPLLILFVLNVWPKNQKWNDIYTLISEMFVQSFENKNILDVLGFLFVWWPHNPILGTYLSPRKGEIFYVKSILTKITVPKIAKIWMKYFTSTFLDIWWIDSSADKNVWDLMFGSYKFQTIFWQSLTFPFFRLIKGYF